MIVYTMLETADIKWSYLFLENVWKTVFWLHEFMLKNFDLIIFD